MEAKEADSASVARFRKNAGGPDDPENPTNDSSSEDEKERDREAERERREAEEDRRAGRDCCKKALKFLFSHIGLTGMVLAYAVAGGFIFQHLEKTNEKQECLKAEERYQPTENDTKYKMWEIAKMFGQDEENIDTALPQFVTVLQKFRNDVLKLGYEGQNCSRMGETDGPGYKWSFASSMLFSVTVMTTIGYGNIAPKTYWGRLVCMAYALLGIPLMLLFLANIGDVMADIFRFVYSKVCCCGCCRRKDKNKVESIQQPGSGAGGGGDGDGNTPEAWKSGYAAQKAGLPPPEGGPIFVEDDEDDDDDEDERISVPLTITMVIIAFYIFMGALLFGVWEEWQPLQAAYFCFVTISTIGFGDVVPGSANFEKVEDQYKMILSAIYMIFGMAILSMCFSLIQEEIIAKFKWVGEKIGIIEKDGDVSKDDSK